MAKSLHHAQQLRLDVLTRHLGDEADNSRHRLVLTAFGRRLEFAVVPEFPDFADLGKNRFGNMVSESAMQTQAESRRPNARQRNVIPRDVDPLEAVVLLKIAEAVSLLLAIREI